MVRAKITRLLVKTTLPAFEPERYRNGKIRTRSNSLQKSNLDWYLTLPEEVRNESLSLAWFLYPNREVIETKIIPRSIEIARKNLRKQSNTQWKSDHHHKIFLKDAQLLQDGIFRAIQEREHLGEVPIDKERCLIWYVKHVTMLTMNKNPFHVAIAFGRLLRNGSPQQILNLFGCWNPGKDERHLRRVYQALQESSWKHYSSFFKGDHQFDLQEVDENSTIVSTLDRMIPWGTGHLSPEPGSWPENGPDDADLAHAWIDPSCFVRMKSGLGFARSFSHYRLPIFKGNDRKQVTPTPPGWDSVQIMKEILFWEWKKKRQDSKSPDNLAVIIDGERCEAITQQPQGFRALLPASGSFVEILEAGITVATCSLIDPDDLPKNGWFTLVGEEHRPLNIHIASFSHMDKPSFLLSVGYQEWQLLGTILALKDLFGRIEQSNVISMIAPLGPDYCLAGWRRGNGLFLKKPLLTGFLLWPAISVMSTFMVLAILDSNAIVFGLLNTAGIALMGGLVCGVSVSVSASTAGGILLSFVLGTGYALLTDAGGGLDALSPLIGSTDPIHIVLGGIAALVRPSFFFMICFSLALSLLGYLMGNTSAFCHNNSNLIRATSIGFLLGGLPIGLSVGLVELMQWILPIVTGSSLAVGVMSATGFGISVYLKTGLWPRSCLYGIAHGLLIGLFLYLSYQVYLGSLARFVLLTLTHIMFHGGFFALSFLIGERLGGWRAGFVACTLEGVLGYLGFLVFYHHL